MRLLLALALAFTLSRAADKPNVLFIMADDLGFSDLGSYGALRVGDMKLVAAKDQPWELYDLAAKDAPSAPARAKRKTGENK